jgi:enamine deaminase RidA (YjgF/YER057c/UK114 family)
VLEEAGSGLDAIVKLTVYLTDMTRLREYPRIKGDFLPATSPPQPTPASRKARDSRSISRAITRRWISCVPS